MGLDEVESGGGLRQDVGVARQGRGGTRQYMGGVNKVWVGLASYPDSFRCGVRKESLLHTMRMCKNNLQNLGDL